MSSAPEADLRNAPMPRVYGYELSRVLGEGAAGVVYEARKAGESAPLAIKILHPYLATDEQVRGRFMREAEILASLSGPSVCPVLAIGETDDTALPYMVMPKIEGRKLSEVDKARLSAKEAVRLVCEICSALEVAHRAGVVHRDLKPDNVIVSRDRVIVVDFGMAKILRGSQEGQSAELTTTGMIFGTPEYMAPEQARGETADPRCDVYAAGVILYELLCGSVPLVAANAILTLVKVSRESAPPLRERTTRPDLSEALEACVMHAIAKDREQRYPSARSFRDALVVAINHPERAAVVRPDHYFDTEGEAGGMTLPLSTHQKIVSSRGPISSEPITERSQEVPAALLSEEDQERTRAAPRSRRPRASNAETMPDLSRESAALPPESTQRAQPRPRPSQSVRIEPPSSRTRAAPLSQPRMPASMRPPPASQPSVRPQVPYTPPPPPAPISSHTGHTPSYVSRPNPMPQNTLSDSKRTALMVWAVMAIVAILTGIYLALRSAA